MSWDKGRGEGSVDGDVKRRLPRLRHELALTSYMVQDACKYAIPYRLRSTGHPNTPAAWRQC